MSTKWSIEQDVDLRYQISCLSAAEAEFVRGGGSEYVRNQIRRERQEAEERLAQLRKLPRFQEDAS